MESFVRISAVSLIGCLMLLSWYYQQRGEVFEKKWDELLEVAEFNRSNNESGVWVYVELHE